MKYLHVKAHLTITHLTYLIHAHYVHKLRHILAVLVKSVPLIGSSDVNHRALSGEGDALNNIEIGSSK